VDRIAPSARLEAQIAEVLNDEVAGAAERLAELGRPGARLVLQRAVEDEVTAFLGRARYQRPAEAAGSRNGTRPEAVQTAEGEIRGAAERFIRRVFPDSRTVIRTRPLEALIIGGYVRGLSDRDLERLMGEAGLGQVSQSTARRICRELRARYKAFCGRSLADVELLALSSGAV
jgi:transposase-like protein